MSTLLLGGVFAVVGPLLERRIEPVPARIDGQDVVAGRVRPLRNAPDWQDGTVTQDWLEYREQQYREVIDRLVHSCREGQGQISSSRVRRGVWNSNADQMPADMPDQAAMNGLLSRLASADRELLAGFFAEEFVSGVHEALVVLHEAQIVPFDDGYEGTPFHDFVGRLGAWPWPDA